MVAATLGLDEIGMNTAGKSADFIVLNADPLDDIATMMQIDRVFLKGAEVGRAILFSGFLLPCRSGNKKCGYFCGYPSTF